MSKRYIHVVDDAAITTEIALKALMDANPANYPVGGCYVLQNGLVIFVTTNNGTAVTLGTVTVT